MIDLGSAPQDSNADTAVVEAPEVFAAPFDPSNPGPRAEHSDQSAAATAPADEAESSTDVSEPGIPAYHRFCADLGHPITRFIVTRECLRRTQFSIATELVNVPDFRDLITVTQRRAGGTPTDITLGIAASYAAQTVVYQTLPPDTLVDDGHRTIPLRTHATEE